MKNIEIDESKLIHQELDYLDKLLFDRFQVAKRKECEKILKLRHKLGMDIQDNFMISDFEFEYNVKFNLKK